MSDPYTQLYLHLVWATWERQPLLTPEREAAVNAYIRNECSRHGCDVLAIGGTENHVHVLLRLGTTIAIQKLIQHIKGGSSHFVTQELEPGAFFKWQGGYGAFTVQRSHVPTVKRYIANQKEHHRNGTLLSGLERDEALRPVSSSVTVTHNATIK